MKRIRHNLEHGVPVRPWAYQVRGRNPPPHPAISQDGRRIEAMLPYVVGRLEVVGAPVTRAQMTRESLTRLQRELRDATETFPLVARDGQIQDFRRRLHLFLDH